jgi:hypothetical protein
MEAKHPRLVSWSNAELIVVRTKTRKDHRTPVAGLPSLIGFGMSCEGLRLTNAIGSCLRHCLETYRGRTYLQLFPASSCQSQSNLYIELYFKRNMSINTPSDEDFMQSMLSKLAVSGGRTR